METLYVILIMYITTLAAIVLIVYFFLHHLRHFEMLKKAGNASEYEDLQTVDKNIAKKPEFNDDPLQTEAIEANVGDDEVDLEDLTLEEFEKSRNIKQ